MKKSLEQLLGKEYTGALAEGAALALGMDKAEALALCREEAEFLPEAFAARMDALLDKVGQKLGGNLSGGEGAPTDSFRAASHLAASPVGSIGFLRLGEDGRLYLAAKSEHYHAPLGHNFPGYRLLDIARRLGVGNAAHNNTRGYVTRLLERELVRTANGIAAGDAPALEAVLHSSAPHVLNRVINLETGSLACEAGVKMMLAKFWRLEDGFPAPEHAGSVPVFLVMGDHGGGPKANYHGTTVLAQALRGMWPEMAAKMEQAGILKAVPVGINDADDFRMKAETYSRPPFRVAGFLHEIILMNYGGIRLEKEYLRACYRVCREIGAPVLCDEIQSCMWYPGMYLFRQYGLDPDFVAVGKGFPGGQYAASRILVTKEMDNLNQFGALVTNGQEELASLAYLVTMAYAAENAAHIAETGEYYERGVRALAAEFPKLVSRVEGLGLLLAVHFHEAQNAKRFADMLNARCIDVSCQTYKAECPPAALTKPPVIATRRMIDFLAGSMRRALQEIEAEGGSRDA